MTIALPDVSVSDIAPAARPIDWVGMQGIDIPITVNEPGVNRQVNARADLQVDLPAADIKGIHMSRLYRLLDKLTLDQPVTPKALYQLLQDMIATHQDCHTHSARLRLEFELMVRRPALKTPGLSGWKTYPVQLDASLQNDRFQLTAQLLIGYSSTCPCSSSLARQRIEQGFLQAFEGQPSITTSDAARWLLEHATLATPHSQRSEAIITVPLQADRSCLGLLAVINAVEEAVQTPLQTAVKRADEQAFAELNGQNLMFVEDAARRICQRLDPGYPEAQVQVRHLESLHPHDAVAWAHTGGQRRQTETNTFRMDSN